MESRYNEPYNEVPGKTTMSPAKVIESKMCGSEPRYSETPK